MNAGAQRADYGVEFGRETTSSRAQESYRTPEFFCPVAAAWASPEAESTKTLSQWDSCTAYKSFFRRLGLAAKAVGY